MQLYAGGQDFSAVKVKNTILNVEEKTAEISICFTEKNSFNVHLLHGAGLCAGSHLVISRLNNHAQSPAVVVANK